MGAGTGGVKIGGAQCLALGASIFGPNPARFYSRQLNRFVNTERRMLK